MADLIERLGAILAKERSVEAMNLLALAYLRLSRG